MHQLWCDFLSYRCAWPCERQELLADRYEAGKWTLAYSQSIIFRLFSPPEVLSSKNSPQMQAWKYRNYNTVSLHRHNSAGERKRINCETVIYCLMLFHVQLIGTCTWHQKSHKMELSNFCWFYFPSMSVSVAHCSFSFLCTFICRGHSVQCPGSYLAKSLSFGCSSKIFLHEF